MIYSLTLAVEQIVTVTISGMTADLDVFMLSACDENACIAYGNATFTTDCLAAGTYYIVVDGYNGAVSTFDLEVTCTDCPVTPDNDTCDEAIDLCAVADGAGAFNLLYTTIGAASDYSLVYPSCTGFSVSGNDIVYVVCLEAGGTLDVTQTGDVDMAMFLMTDCADPQNSCVIGSDNCCTGADEYINYTSVAGGTYYLVVAGYSLDPTGTLYGTVTGCCATDTESNTWGEMKALFR